MVAVPKSDLHSNILKVLEAGTAPKDGGAIHKALPVGGRPKTAADLEPMLTEMVAAGSIIEFPGKKAKYARGPAESWALAKLLELLAPGAPLAEPKITKALVPHDRLLASVIKQLKKEGRVFEHPPLKPGPPSYGTSRPDPHTYLGKDLEKIEKEFAKLKKQVDKALVKAKALGFLSVEIGGEFSRLPEGLRPPSAEIPPIIEAMCRLEPRAEQGLSVSIVDIRKELAPRHDQASIDREIVALAKKAVIDLHSHQWPDGLSAEDKRSLMEDGRGGWFDGVTLRRRSA